MEYTFVERAERDRGVNWFGHEIKLYIKPVNESVLINHLTEHYGKRGVMWRMKKPHALTFSFYDHNRQLTVRFVSKVDAFRFKLTWEEDETPPTMDSLIASLKKIALNSSYGNIGGSRRGAMLTMPTWTMPPLSQSTPGIHPTHGPLTYKQHNSRLQSRTPNPCDEIILLDHESSPFWIHQSTRECNTWFSYQAQLDSELNNDAVLYL